MNNEEYKKNAKGKLKSYEDYGFHVIKISDVNEGSFEKIFNENDKILIVSTHEDVKNSKELYNKIKILKLMNF
jgi:PDZ domain-containing secreted protein